MEKRLCGCGGNPECRLIGRDYNTRWQGEVICSSCGINVLGVGTYTDRETAAEDAIEAWNTAMRLYEVPVKSQIEKDGEIYDRLGLCGRCEQVVNNSYDFCPYCGSKLDWVAEDDEELS